MASESILFVCTANICRSPLAEWTWRHLRHSERFFKLPPSGSAGIDADNGLPPCSEAISIARREGFAPATHSSRPLDLELLETYDLILCMEQAHKARILGAYPQFGKKVYLLTEYLASTPPAEPDIDDPYGGSPEDFERCYRRIRTEVERFASSMLEDLHAENAKKR